jgi:glucosamine 6-phosphate synthetase-like amidotransferase/phosphosugar isomerase protein
MVQKKQGELMCGILGVHVLSNDSATYNFLLKVIKELHIRGTHAHGLAFAEQVAKEVYPAYNPEDMLSEFWATHSDSFIYHNRYATSGDYHDLKNNMPLGHHGTYLAMNGVISQALPDEWATKYGITDRQTENDAEILLHRYMYEGDLDKFVRSEKDASIAYVMIHDGEVFGQRNTKRPLYYYEDKYVKLLTCTLDTITRAGGDAKNVSIVPPYDMVFL